MLVWGAFLFPNIVSATTIYQQLTDSSGVIGFSGTGLGTFVGSFTISTTTTIVQNDTALAVVTVTAANSPIDFATIELFTGGSDCFHATGFVAEYDAPFVGNASTTGADNFYTYKAASTYTLNPGTYYICPSGNGSIHYQIRTNLAVKFIYGYLTANGTGTSVPIVPGLPGFSDVGISTTSQQAYCNSNFSTSTGLLGDLGQSISLGICNVSVFLFVPNALALTNFSSLTNTLQERIPFSYYFDVQNIFTGSTASNTQNMVAYTANLSSFDFSTSTSFGPILPTQPFSFFSSSTISQYLPVGMHDFLYNLMIAAIWVEVLFLLYRKIVPNKAKI